jgi:hypothetical protein
MVNLKGCCTSWHLQLREYEMVLVVLYNFVRDNLLDRTNHYLDEKKRIMICIKHFTRYQCG